MSERERLTDRLNAWNRQNYTQLSKNEWDRGEEVLTWRVHLITLAKRLGDNRIPLANLMPYLKRCEIHRPVSNYGLNEVDELLYSIRQLIMDPDGDRLTHRKEDLAEADMRGELTTALFQPPPGWPWG